MSRLKISLKKILKQIMSFFPTKLPIGMEQFDMWANDIILTYDLPDNDSIKFALATAILHLESVSKLEINLLVVKLQIPFSSYKSKRFFGQVLLKGASNQVASGIMQELKMKQQKLAEAQLNEGK